MDLEREIAAAGKDVGQRDLLRTQHQQLASLRGDYLEWERLRAECRQVPQVREQVALLREALRVRTAPLATNTTRISEAPGLEAETTSAQNRVPYSPGQAAGRPDSPGFAKPEERLSRCWLPSSTSGGKDWLRVDYAEPVDVRCIRLHTYGDGMPSSIRIMVIGAGGAEVFFNEEDDAAAKNAFFSVGSTSIPWADTNQAVMVSSVRVYCDTTLSLATCGIDAVELVGQDGKSHWPVRATASSFLRGAQ